MSCFGDHRYGDYPVRPDLVICGDCSTRATPCLIPRDEIGEHDVWHAENARLVVVDDRPVSSCCQAEIERRVNYSDTHVFFVQEAETDDEGKVVSATYKFAKTYDGIDGQDAVIVCSECGRDIQQDGIDWMEG